MKDRPDSVLKPYLDVLFERKAEDVVALDVRKLTSYTDAFIIASGRSNRQVSAIGKHIHTEMKKKGVRAFSVDGLEEGKWVLLDYGDVIIHVFLDETRRFYDLEGLWSDARRIDTGQ
ncbi:MAG: ribosome silencing factor [Proteobacteria bacterium]|nr:ribosome silencing factor [Pseudomonadota bacterium]